MYIITVYVSETKTYNWQLVSGSFKCFILLSFVFSIELYVAIISCHSVCPSIKDAMLVFRMFTCSRSWEIIVFICFFARFISLSLIVSIWNFIWREMLEMWSISLVPFIKRKTLFWNFWSLSIWHFLLLIEGNGAYSIVGLMILLYRVLFTCREHYRILG